MDAVAGWHEFNVAMIGATAALAGLVIVAASVNISYIVKAGSMTARLASGIAGLVLALVGSAVGLIPGIGPVGYGTAVGIAAAAASVFPVHAAWMLRTHHTPEYPRWVAKAAIAFLTPVTYLVGAVLLVSGSDAGLLWFAAGSMLSVVAALVMSWVVLVEVLR